MHTNDASAEQGRLCKNPSFDGSSNSFAPENSLLKLGRFNVSREFRSSNLTTNHFLGVKERSWMRDPHVTDTPQYAARPNVDTGTLRRSSSAALQNVQTSMHQPQPTRTIPVEEIASHTPSQGIEANTTTVNTGQKSGISSQAPLGGNAGVIDLTLATRQYSLIHEANHEVNTGHNKTQQPTEYRQSLIHLIDPPPTTVIATTIDVDREQIPLTLMDGNRSVSTVTPLDSRQERPACTDLSRSSAPGPVVNTSMVPPPKPPNQLLTPVASPEQVTQSLHRKRTVDAAQISNPSPQPPVARLRSDSLQEAPLSGIIPHQSYGVHQGDALSASTYPITGYPHPNAPYRPVNLSRGTPTHSSPTPRSLHTIPANQTSLRRTPSHTSTLKGQSYLAVLQNTTDNLKKRVVFTNTANELRLPWLRNACEDEDLIFLLLNQILCATFLDARLAQNLGLDNTHIAGMQTLQLLFGNNAELPREYAEFLAGWPNSVYSLMSDPVLKTWLTFISHSLNSFGTKWEGFRQLCIQRRIPPGAREIADNLDCLFSKTLTRAVFSSLCRQITHTISRQRVPPADVEAFQLAAFELFIKDHEGFLLLVRSSTNLPPLDQSRTNFSTSYVYLHQRFFDRYLQAQATSPINLPYSSGIASNVAGAHNVQPLPPPSTMRVQAPNNAGISHVPVYHAVSTRGDLTLSATVPFSTAHAQQGRRQTAPSTVQNSMVSNRPSHAPPPNLPPIVSNRHSLGQQGPPTPRHFHEMIPNTTSGTNVIPPRQQNPGSIQQNFIQNQTVTALQPQIDSYHHRASVQSPMIRQDNLPLLPIRPPPLLANPVAHEVALHQAHLQEPNTILSPTLPSTTKRMYQFMDSLVLGPRLFSSHDSFFMASFEVEEDMISRVAHAQENDDALSLPTRTIGNESLILHLRCVEIAPTDQEISLSTWAALPTYWPEHIFITVNDQHLEFRRKRHYKRDLPVDVTPFVRKGRNDVVVCFYAEEADIGKAYAVGCETIVFRDPTLVTGLLEKITAQDSMDSILQAMQPTVAYDDDDDDDDMQIVTDSLVISVADPLSSSLYLTPVRGKTCLHRECFSLETFLESRSTENGNVLTSVSQWVCPHCKRDARPCSLVIDGFIQEACQKLVTSNQGDAKAIALKPDGSWTVRQQEDTETPAGQKEAKAESAAKVGASEPPKIDAERPLKTMEAMNRPRTIVEIIDLDSD